VEVFGDPLGDGFDDSVAAHAVSGGVAVLFAVCSVEGVIVGPSHEAFAFEWGESSHCELRLSVVGGEYDCGGGAAVTLVEFVECRVWPVWFPSFVVAVGLCPSCFHEWGGRTAVSSSAFWRSGGSVFPLLLARRRIPVAARGDRK